MDSMSAFAMGQANRGKELMVFDWIKAAHQANRGKELMVFDWIKAAQRIKETGAKSASAGLAGDWGWTGGDILTDGMPTPKEDTYTFLASTWATPELDLDGSREDCFKMQSETSGWYSGTYWPQEALDILDHEIDGDFEVVPETKLLE